MPYFGQKHLQIALHAMTDRLLTFHVGVLSMFYSGVPTSHDPADAVIFGAPNDNDFLMKAFNPVGGPRGKPFYLPAGKDQGKTRWRDVKYSGRVLHRQRTKDFPELFLHPTSTTYAFKSGYASTLAAQLSNFPIVYLAAWFYRQQEFLNFQDCVDKFIVEFKIDRDGLIGTVFDKAIPSDFEISDLRTEPMTDAEIGLLIGVGAPAAIPQFDRSDLDLQVIDFLKKRRIEVRPEMVGAVIDGWLARDIVVLVGSPGTGKTVLAKGLADAIEHIFGQNDVRKHQEQVTREHDFSRFLGYENLEGRLVPSAFSSHVLLDETQRFSIVPLVLDEWNLARIDNYFAPLLASIETGDPIPLPGARDSDDQVLLPIDTLIIATCNSYVDEPDTRQPLSTPVKRRSVILEMPNLLAVESEKSGVEKALRKFGDLMLQREREEIDGRFREKAESTFDHFRRTAHVRITKYDDFPIEVRLRLEKVFEVLLSSPSGRRGITLGVFKDVIVSIAYSASIARMEATLCTQVAGKLLHMLRDDLDVLRRAGESCAGASGYDIVKETLTRFEDLSRRSGGAIMPPV